MRGPSPLRPTRFGLESLEARDVPASNFLAFGAAPGGLPLVEVFRPNGASLGQFQAFESSFRGGVRAAAAELDGNANTLEVITAPGPGGGPVVRVFQIDLTTLARTEVASFFAFNPDFRGGLHVAAGNVAGPDARQEIIVAADAGGGPRVRVLSLLGNTAFTAPGPLGDFFALNVDFLGGVRVAAGEVDGNLLDGDELVVAAGTAGGPRVQVFRSDGAVLADFFTFRPDFLGGVQVSFENTGAFGRVQFDGLALDPSQRNTALNAAALNAVATTGFATVGTVGTTTNAFTTSGGGGAIVSPVTTGFTSTGFTTTGAIGFGTSTGTTTGIAGFGTPGNFTTGTPGAFTTGIGTTGVGTTGLTTTTTGTSLITPMSGGPILSSTSSPTTTTIGANGLPITTPTGTSLVTTTNATGFAAGTGFTFFGDPGPLTPLPALFTPPFNGPVIGGATTLGSNALLV